MKINYLYHQKGWRAFRTAFAGGISLSPSVVLIYNEVMEQWNDARFPDIFPIYRAEVKRNAGCNSDDTYARAMKTLHKLGLIVYDDRSNDKRPCTVQVKPLDEVYKDFVAAKSEMNFSDYMKQWKPQQSQAEETQTTPQTPQTTPEKTPQTTPQTTPQSVGDIVAPDADKPKITKEQARQLSLLLIDEIRERAGTLGVNVVINGNELAKAEELVRMMGSSDPMNCWQLCLNALDRWQAAAEADAFLRDRFYPSGIYICINRFNNHKAASPYPLRNPDGVPTTSLDGVAFPTPAELDRDSIRQTFKKMKGKNEKQNNNLFNEYLKAQGFRHELSAGGWIKDG